MRGVYLYQFVIDFYRTVPALNSRVCGFILTSQLDNKMAANRALMEAARGLITCQTLLSRLMEMIHMMLYEEEVSGALWPERIYTRWPARCHVTCRRAQRDCPSTTPLLIVAKVI